MQGGQLKEIRATVGRDVLAYVPELERDVTGLEMIERVAALLFEGGQWDETTKNRAPAAAAAGSAGGAA